MMKILLILLFLFACSGVFGQDSSAYRLIDGQVAAIRASRLTPLYDTLREVRTDVGLETVTCLTLVLDHGELIKYESLAEMTLVGNAGAQKITTLSRFYFEHNILIKVEEQMERGKEKMARDWYYANERPLLSSDTPPGDVERASFLLSLAKGFLKEALK